jgi:drug/metabolite transporter (DMT)-like permease
MTRRALVLFALLSIIWGLPYLFIRIAVEEVSPAFLVFGRTFIASLILLPVALMTVDLRPILARWRWVAAFAIVETAIPWVLLGAAEQHIASSLAGLLIAGVPLVSTVIAVVSGGRDRMHASGVLGLLVGLAGVAAIVGVNLDSASLPALAAIAVVVLGYAVGPAILSRRLAGLSSVGVMALSISLCAVLYAPIAFVERPAVMPSPAALISVIVLGVVCTATAFIIFAALIAEMGPVRSTVVTYVNPAVAAVLGVLVLGEVFSPGMAVGFALVLLGSVLATRPHPETRDAAMPDAAPEVPPRAAFEVRRDRPVA